MGFDKVHGRQRWRGPDGRLYEWDRRHGHVEMYNANGRHLGVLDSSGKSIKHAVKGRVIDV
ncbi:MAG: hypothetical protein KF838_09945 [Phycisphaeraceae bacterium]|nr:MAG: hypothetical protein KF838_09945 [Phycisphaeraceae bacterium]